MQLREIDGSETMDSERRRCRLGLYPGCLLNTKEREDIEYLECSRPRGEEHGHADDIEGEVGIVHQAIEDWQENVRFCSAGSQHAISAFALELPAGSVRSYSLTGTGGGHKIVPIDGSRSLACSPSCLPF